jgi:hypothetical protein
LFCSERFILVITGYFSDIAMTQQRNQGYSPVIFWDGWLMLKMAGMSKKAGCCCGKELEIEALTGKVLAL